MADPNYLASITFSKLVLGKDNVLSTDISGTPESVEAITMDDLKAFYDRNISPSAASFHIVGDVEQARVEKALSGLGERWPAKEVAMPSFVFPPSPEKAVLYFVDVPGAKQSVINIGNLALTRDNPDFYKAEVANYMLGGTASARGRVHPPVRAVACPPGWGGGGPSGAHGGGARSLRLGAGLP